MGILSNIFRKPTPPPHHTLHVLTPERDENAPPNQYPSASTSFEKPARTISFGGKKAELTESKTSGARNISTPSASPISDDNEHRAAANSSFSEKEIVLSLDDVLPKVPAEFLKPEARESKAKLRFAMRDSACEIARGRAAMRLSELAKSCPEIFRAPSDSEDREVPLPLEKIVAQLGPLPLRHSAKNFAHPDSPFANIAIEKTSAA